MSAISASWNDTEFKYWSRNSKFRILLCQVKFYFMLTDFIDLLIPSFWCSYRLGSVKLFSSKNKNDKADVNAFLYFFLLSSPAQHMPYMWRVYTDGLCELRLYQPLLYPPDLFSGSPRSQPRLERTRTPCWLVCPPKKNQLCEGQQGERKRQKLIPAVTPANIFFLVTLTHEMLPEEFSGILEKAFSPLVSLRA